MDLTKWNATMFMSRGKQNVLFTFHDKHLMCQSLFTAHAATFMLKLQCPVVQVYNAEIIFSGPKFKDVSVQLIHMHVCSDVCHDHSPWKRKQKLVHARKVKQTSDFIHTCIKTWWYLCTTLGSSMDHAIIITPNTCQVGYILHKIIIWIK